MLAFIGRRSKEFLQVCRIWEETRERRNPQATPLSQEEPPFYRTIQNAGYKHEGLTPEGTRPSSSKSGCPAPMLAEQPGMSVPMLTAHPKPP